MRSTAIIREETTKSTDGKYLSVMGAQSDRNGATAAADIHCGCGRRFSGRQRQMHPRSST